jgi:protein TonB
MPQELLRDVLRTGDARGRTRRRLSVLPVSIAAHAIALGLFLIGPLAGTLDVPAIVSPLQAARYMPTIAPPAPPPPSLPREAPPVTTSAPLEAPSEIAPEQPAAPSRSADGGLESSIGVDAGPPLVIGLENTAPVPVPPPPPPPKLARVGHQGIREPKKIVHVAPEYPVIAQRAGVEGTVILEAILDATGRVDRLRVIKSQMLLDDAAMRAVQQWRYSPTELNGVPVPVLMTITVRFTLSRE